MFFLIRKIVWLSVSSIGTNELQLVEKQEDATDTDALSVSSIGTNELQHDTANSVPTDVPTFSFLYRNERTATIATLLSQK